MLESREGTIGTCPLEDSRRVSDLTRRFPASLRTQVQDHLDSVFRTRVKRGEVLGGAEARNVPLDPLGNGAVRRKDDLPQRSSRDASTT
jgi:hypothetical protein